MAWIRTIAPGEATGLLKRLYDQAWREPGRCSTSCASRASGRRCSAPGWELYKELMISPRSPLSRAQREMIATAVSQVNACHY